MRNRETYEFTLLLQGADVLKDRNLEALRRAGCHDALFGKRGDVFYADFAREGQSFGETLVEAIRQLESAVPGLQVVRVEPEEFVSAAAIAERTGRTRESVRLLIEGKRGPGGFPSPIAWTSRTRKLWRWADVAQWFQTNLAQTLPGAQDAAYITAFNAILAFRQSVVLFGINPEIKVQRLAVRDNQAHTTRLTVWPLLVAKEPSPVYESKSLLFDDSITTDESYKQHGETNWEFLNRAQQIEFANCRTLLDDWFGRLSSNGKRLLEGGLKSDSEAQFKSAFFELYVHETLVRLGFSVEVHPELAGRATRPDFLASGPQGAIYVEAKALAPADSTRSKDNLEEAVYDALDDVHSPNFFLWVEKTSAGTHAPNIRLLRAKLEKWLTLLDPDAVQAELDRTNSLEGLPAFPWETSGWALNFRAIPKRKARGKAGVRTLGNRPFKFGYPNEIGRIRKALHDKASRYGELRHPYVVALLLDWDMNGEEAADALYGTSEAGVGALRQMTVRRRKDGMWSGSTSKIAAVLIATHIWPWTVASQVPVLWQRPTGRLEIGEQTPWRNGHLEPDGVRCHVDSPNRDMADFFGLWNGWPRPRTETKPTGDIQSLFENADIAMSAG